MEETAHSQAKRWLQSLEEQEKGPQEPPPPNPGATPVQRTGELLSRGPEFSDFRQWSPLSIKNIKDVILPTHPIWTSSHCEGLPHPTSGVQVWGAPGDPPQLSPPTGSQ